MYLKVLRNITEEKGSAPLVPSPFKYRRWSASLFLRFRWSSTIPVASGNHKWFTRWQRNVVSTYDVRKLIEIPVSSLFDSLISLDIDVTVKLHASSGWN